MAKNINRNTYERTNEQTNTHILIHIISHFLMLNLTHALTHALKRRPFRDTKARIITNQHLPFVNNIYTDIYHLEIKTNYL